MEKLTGRGENVLFRFARSRAGKLTGVFLLGAASLETYEAVVDFVNDNIQDAKNSVAVGAAEASLGAAIFVAREKAGRK